MWDNRASSHYAAADYTEARLWHRVTVVCGAGRAPPSPATGRRPPPRPRTRPPRRRMIALCLNHKHTTHLVVSRVFILLARRAWRRGFLSRSYLLEMRGKCQY